MNDKQNLEKKWQYITLPLRKFSRDEKISNIKINNSIVDKATDDWPFFYMPKKIYPFSYVIVILLIVTVSILYTKNISAIKNTGPSPS